jgi:conjugal transfer/entry exclusion protein
MNTRTMRWWIILSLLLQLLHVKPSEAQEAVVEVGMNLFFNTITSIQTALTVANQVIDLTPLGDVAAAEGYAEDMAMLGQLVDAAEGLAYDLGSLQAQVNTLFSLDGAPATSREFAERMREIQRVTWQSYNYALRTQTLLSTMRRTIEHALALMEAVGAVIGTLQSGQTTSQAINKLVQLESEMKVTTTAFQRAQSVDAMSDQLILQSIKNINDEVWSKEP